MNIHDYYESQGQGEPIVFIHGSYASTSTWKKMVQALSASHQCISIKLPGHCGTADPEDFDYPTVETELTLIEQIINHCTSQPVHLVGHSYGGVVALALALKKSVPLSSLTLYEPVSVWLLDVVGDTQMSSEVQTFLNGYRKDIADEKPHACGQLIDFWTGKGSYDALPDFIKDGMVPLAQNNIRHWDICTVANHSAPDLQQLTVPTAVVCGTESNAVAHSIVRHLHQLLPHCDRFEVSGASHFLVTSHVELCLSVLNRMLAKTDMPEETSASEVIPLV